MTLSTTATLNHHSPPDAECIDEIARCYFALSEFEGFIRHPDNIPLQLSSPKNNELREYLEEDEHSSSCSGIGLCFDNDRYISPGEYIKLTIQPGHKEQIFFAKVVLVKNQETHFTIGVWFDTKQEATRLREIQQRCHLENYLREKRCQEGPYLSQKIVAEEWVNRFSNLFPTI